ncbi:MAG: glycoside hydrolase family 88/105 protein [Lachnospiraceae bacterium]|jgi:unsaturated rhamnogalacturonyl hydrolase
MSEEKKQYGLTFDREKVLDAIDRIVRRTMQMDLTWEWPCGVAYYGICRAAEKTGRDEYLQMVKTRVDELIDLGIPGLNVNTCAMGHCLLDLYRATGDEKYKNILNSQIEYLEKKALRFGDGVLQHTVSDSNDFPEQCWADTLFMAAYLLLRVGIEKSDETLIKDALKQWYWHIEFLQDDNGLFFHGYSHVKKSHMSGIHWGRANAWAAYTMSHVKPDLPGWYLYPECMDINGSLDLQLSALKNYQTENGLWRTIIDDPESYEEVSASAGIAAAMVIAGNPLHYKYINKAIEGVLSNVAEDGTVKNVSGGTAVMRDGEGYRNVTRKWIQGWGQGLALALFAAVLDKIIRS